MELNSVLTSMLFMLSITLQTTNSVTYKESLLMGQSIGLLDTLVSANGSFELGFFSEQNSSKYYVGMWFREAPKDKFVWVANRNHAATGSSPTLTIYKDGNLVVLDGDTVHLVTNVSNISSTHAMFLDSGNLLLVNNSNLNILWESFDHPTDTLLPGMKIGFDPESGQIWSLRSWTSALDPSPGVFSLELNVSMQNLIIKRESAIYWIGDENFESLINRDYMITNQDYWTWQGEYGSRLVLEESGALNQQNWSQDTQQWVSFQSSKCRTNAICGNFGVCNPQAHNPCGCLKGFKPYDGNSWKKGKTSAGCVRKIELLCTNTSSNGLNDDFFPLEGVKLPSDSSLDFDTDKASKCVNACSTNCSCIAYAYDLTEGRCLLWHVQLFNLKNVSVDVGVNNNSPTLFLKLAASELKNNESNTRNNPDHKSSHSRKIALIIVILILFVALLTLALFAYYYRRKKLRGNGEDLLLFDVGMSMKVNSSEITDSEKVTKVDKREVRLPLFNFVSVSAATDNFSAENKIGEGGFGPVYKGKLLNGDEVAVKRLSSRSGQGWEELKNEALLIAKLQHNNLVRLLGCCIERDEKMLIYEFMPNKSLDFFLFDATKGRTLDWGTRVRIIDGISQGLLYLHQYSRFRIIHRDLKASNILLDINMNPKISDFGMARMFGGNQLQANTNRIVGTYGYMAPEYALEGLFSVKSDVFSFGVLLLEIISGKKNTGFYNTNSLNLLGHAWDLWTSGRGIELMDSVVQDASIKKMVVQRYVNIALLCVQESAADRPTMSDVVSMLGNENAVLPYPKTYAFLNVRGMNKHSGSDGSSTGNVSVNAMTATVMEAR